MTVRRRDVLKVGLLAAGATTLPIAIGVRDAVAGRSHVQSPPFTPYSRPLRIPPVLNPVRTIGNVDFYEVVQTTGRQEILPGKIATVWGYNGIYPGPTFAVESGRAIVVTQRNALTASATGMPGGVPTTVHPHGMDVEARSDGHPLNLVLPGGFLEHHYPNVQPATTLFYHDHAIDHTSRNVYMGLGGFYLISDQHERSLPLPQGPFDIPLCIQDKVFNADGSLFFPTDAGLPQRQGVFGDVLLVNGTPQPFLRVQRRKYRFRLLNASDARSYALRLSTGDSFTVIATDGGLMPHPVEVNSLPMAVAERYSIIVDFAKYAVGTSILLQNTDHGLFGDEVAPAKVSAAMRFDVVADAVDTSSVPFDLAPPLEVNPAAATVTRRWVFERENDAWVMNGKPFDGNRVDARPKQGSTEIWEFVNKSGGWRHPVHVHLVQYLILDRNGAPPRPFERGPKDTVALGPDESIRVVMKFSSRFTGTYVFHCHNLSHEDNMMMTQFEVVPWP
ncbi:MAG: Bilirubin oxidase [Frankiales bacterium]|nr:Bilirubin oxidase [Frankiales bacterium]